jgi:hypothetical protein
VACLKKLFDICGRIDLIPDSLQIELHDNPAGDALYRGGFAGVFKCTMGSRMCSTVDQGLEVVVKVLRTHSNGDMREMTRVSYYRASVPSYVLARLP